MTYDEQLEAMTMDEIITKRESLDWDVMSSCRKFSTEELRAFQDDINWRVYLEKFGAETEFRTLLEFHDHVQGNIDWKKYSIDRHGGLGNLPVNYGLIGGYGDGRPNIEPWSEHDEQLKDKASKEFWEEVSRSYVIIPSFAQTFKDQLVPECLLENESLKNMLSFSFAQRSWAEIATRPISEDILINLMSTGPHDRYPLDYDAICMNQTMSADFIREYVPKAHWRALVFNDDIPLSTLTEFSMEFDKYDWAFLERELPSDTFEVLKAVTEQAELANDNPEFQQSVPEVAEDDVIEIDIG